MFQDLQDVRWSLGRVKVLALDQTSIATFASNAFCHMEDLGSLLFQELPDALGSLRRLKVLALDQNSSPWLLRMPSVMWTTWVPCCSRSCRMRWGR